MQDNEIVSLYLERNEKAIEETECKYGAYCMSIARNILHTLQDSQECVNDAYLRAWNSIPPHIPDSLRAFVGKITRRLAINMYEKSSAKKRGKDTVRLVLDELSECIPDGKDGDITQGFVITETVNSFLAGLPEQNRNIFVRRYWYMSSVKEIASEYGIGESKVKMRLMRMRNELKNRLEEEGIII